MGWRNFPGQTKRWAIFLVLAWVVGVPTVCHAGLVVCVCPESFEKAWQPWVKYRRRQGYLIRIVRPQATAAQVREAINKISVSQELKAVVLIGDSPTFDKGKFGESKPEHIPTFYSQAKVNVLFGSEPEIASDLPYGDLNDDGIVDVAIGRIPAVSADQLAGYVKRMLRYEQGYQDAAGKRDIHFVAGVGGFGPAVDGVLTSVTRRFISQGIPGSFRVTMTQASWQSPFCPDPFSFGQHTLNRLNDGGLFWIYMGHGLRNQLDRVNVPNAQPISIMKQENLAGVAIKGLPPICVFLACYVGAYDSLNPCIGEQLVMHDKGPVAVYAASRVSMPYAMSVMGDGLLRQCFRLREEILGNVVTNAKRSLIVPRSADRTANRQLLDSLAGNLSPAPELLKEEREEHALMFNLLGDPLLQLNYPSGVKLNCLPTVKNGQKLMVTFQAPVAGEAVLELATERGIQRFEPLKREHFQRELAKAYDDEYQRANDAVWLSSSWKLSVPGLVSHSLAIKDVKPGFQTVRLYLQSDGQVYIGSKRIYVSD
ncbi:MAG: hypothetical protein CMJ76_02555 [Planctomycetaceae bacterium]|nr:hypothetical protein [Planctomycetaceae bacterium]